MKKKLFFISRPIGYKWEISMLQLNGFLSSLLSLSRDAFALSNITPLKRIVCVEIVLPFDRKAYTTLLGTCQSLARNEVYVLFFFLFVFDCSVSANGVCVWVCISICCRCTVTSNGKNVLFSLWMNGTERVSVCYDIPTIRRGNIYIVSQILQFVNWFSLSSIKECVCVWVWCSESNWENNFPRLQSHFYCRWAQFTWFYIIHITVFWLLH